MDFWLGEIRTYARKINKIVLVGNKKDIDRENRKVSYEEGNGNESNDKDGNNGKSCEECY